MERHVLQRNPNPWPVTLPEYRDESGAVYPTATVEPGAELDWPITIAGFENLTPAEPEPAPEPAADAVAKASAKAPAKNAAKTAEGVTA